MNPKPSWLFWSWLLLGQAVLAHCACLPSVVDAKASRVLAVAAARKETSRHLVSAPSHVARRAHVSDGSWSTAFTRVEVLEPRLVCSDTRRARLVPMAAEAEPLNVKVPGVIGVVPFDWTLRTASLTSSWSYYPPLLQGRCKSVSGATFGRYELGPALLGTKEHAVFASCLRRPAPVNLFMARGASNKRA